MSELKIKQIVPKSPELIKNTREFRLRNPGKLAAGSPFKKEAGYKCTVEIDGQTHNFTVRLTEREMLLDKRYSPKELPDGKIGFTSGFRTVAPEYLEAIMQRRGLIESDGQTKESLQVLFAYKALADQFLPCSPEEEKQLMQKAASGEEKAKEQLLGLNILTVIRLALRWAKNGGDLEELLAFGLEKLNSAIDNISLIKKPLSKIFPFTLEHQMQQEFDKAERGKIKIDPTVNIEVIKNLPAKEMSPEDSIVSLNLSEQTKKVLATITPREDKILRMRFGITETGEIKKPEGIEEVGKDFEVLRERIRQIEAQALRKLKN